MTGYLNITPSVAYTVLCEILTSSGVTIDDVDHHKIDKLLGPKAQHQTYDVIPMVSIPIESDALVVVEEVHREQCRSPSPALVPMAVVCHERVPPALNFSNPEHIANAVTTHFNEVEMDLLRQCLVIDEENMELAYMRMSLSLSMLEAEFLRMQLRLFNLKARSILELFQYCEGSNSGFCRCPEIRKRVYEMGILVQRAGQ